MVRRLFSLVALALTGCVGGFPAPKAAAGPVFDPIAFFAGPSDGLGRLKILLRGQTIFHVASLGRVAPDGSLLLDQRIERAGHPAQQRQWRIRRDGAGYAATLSSAEGPVTAAVEGNLLRLDFREKGLSVHQDIALAPDGRSARNRMTFSKLGLRVGAAEERIVKRD